MLASSFSMPQAKRFSAQSHIDVYFTLYTEHPKEALFEQGSNMMNDPEECSQEPLSDMKIKFHNDPSAGSPTETLLRLLLPLNIMVDKISSSAAGTS